MSKASSSKGRLVPLAVTGSTSGNSWAKFGSGTSLTAVICSGHGYIASKKLWLSATPGSVSKPVSPTPTSTIVVSGPGRSSSRNSASLRRLFQSDARAARPVSTLR